MTCIKCGKEIVDNCTFCPICGEKQVKKYRKRFERKGVSEADFINEINAWLCANPRVANLQCKWNCRTGFGILTNKHVLETFDVEYELFERANTNRYCLVKEERFSWYAKKSKTCVENFKKNHPQATVVDWVGGTHSRGKIGCVLLGGIGAINRMNAYIFYKSPVK